MFTNILRKWGRALGQTDHHVPSWPIRTPDCLSSIGGHRAVNHILTRTQSRNITRDTYIFLFHNPCWTIAPKRFGWIETWLEGLFVEQVSLSQARFFAPNKFETARFYRVRSISCAFSHEWLQWRNNAISGKEFMKIKNPFPDIAFDWQSSWPLYVVNNRVNFYLMISSFGLHVRCTQSSIHSKML